MFRSLSLVISALAASVAGHGAMVSPLSRNAVDRVLNVTSQRCSNVTGDSCKNGQVCPCITNESIAESADILLRPTTSMDTI